MWQQMIAVLKSWFIFPNLKPEWLLIAVGLAIVFGAVWLLAHWPPLFKRPWLWVVAVVSAFLTLLAVVFVQIPLQRWTGEGILNVWGQAAQTQWLWLASIPVILLSGLVQEGAKMVPMVAWWWRSGRRIDPRLGLGIGAVAGAAFGIYRGVLGTRQCLRHGLDLAGRAVKRLPGPAAVLGEVLHRRRPYRYVGPGRVRTGPRPGLAVLPHRRRPALRPELRRHPDGTSKLTINQVEIYVAVLAVLFTAVALWLRWKKRDEIPPPLEAAIIDVMPE